MNDKEKEGDLVLLSELNLSVSELLFTSFLYYLGSNPASTYAFTEDLINASDWIDRQQKEAIIQTLKSELSSDYLNSDQYICWECVLSNLNQPT